MRREKFYFNTHTLQYEQVVTSTKTKIFRAIGISCGIFVAALVLLPISYHFFPTPKEEALIREMEQMKRHYADMQLEVDRMTKVLTNLKERDASVHRMVFGMEPIDNDEWEAGIGGHEKYGLLTKFKNSGATLVAATLAGSSNVLTIYRLGSCLRQYGRNRAGSCMQLPLLLCGTRVHCVVY